MKTVVRVVIFCLSMTGCGTTRTTDTARTATEMLLISQAIDKAVAQIDFSPLAGKTVYLDAKNIEPSTVDRGYLISTLRQQLVSCGAWLTDEIAQAVYVVEARSGGIGTDRHTLLVGTPQFAVPAIVPGVPTQIPEIALYKRNDQKGIAKIAAFAYERTTGRVVWQSGIAEDISRQKDHWLLGSGPYTKGTIRRGTELAGEALPKLPTLPLLSLHDEPIHEPLIKEPMVKLGGRTDSSLWPTNPLGWIQGESAATPPAIPIGIMGVTGAAPIIHHPLIKR